MLDLRFLLVLLLSFFYCYCDKDTEAWVAEFDKEGFFDSQETVKNRIGSFEEPTVFEHHNYLKLTNFLYKYSRKYPNLAYLYSIGKSVQGRDLPVITISRNAKYETPGVPNVKYVANMHGNEITGREVLLNLVQVLLENYGKNEYLTSLVNKTSIHIMPTMNPDGYEVATEGDASGIKGRQNANMVDLNRDFPYRFRVKNEVPQPETMAVMNWTNTIPFVLSANLHDGSLLVNYPYDDGKNDRTVSRTPDHELFLRLAYSYANSHKQMSRKGPRCSPDTGNDPNWGIINGAEWYPVSGGMQDWVYVNTDCFELTIEMNCHKFSSQRMLRSLWNDHKFALIGYIAQVHNSLNGFIKDAVTGKGIEGAEIQINKGGKIVHSSKYGAYHRLLNPGRYAATFAHPLYAAVTRDFTITVEQPFKKLDVYMHRNHPRAVASDLNFGNSVGYTSKAELRLLTLAFLIVYQHF